MTKADIINEVSGLTGLSKVEVEVVLEGIVVDIVVDIDMVVEEKIMKNDT